MWPNPQETFTEEILNGKLRFLCSVPYVLNTSLNWRNKEINKNKPKHGVFHMEYIILSLIRMSVINNNKEDTVLIKYIFDVLHHSNIGDNN